MTQRHMGLFLSVTLCLSFLCGPGSAAEDYRPPTNVDELAQWVTGAFPEWDGDMVSGFVGDLSRALEETSTPLTPAEQSELIAHTPALIMHSNLSYDELMPSDAPVFFEAYRYNLQNYVDRGPIPPEERAQITTQLGELIRYGRDSWARLGMPGDPEAEAMLESQIETVWWRLESPFAFQFKRPFTEAEMKALYDSIDEESYDMLQMKEEDPEERPESIAHLYAMFMFDGLVEFGLEEQPPIPEEMQILLSQTFEERGKLVKERAAQEHAAYVKQFQEKQNREHAMMAQLRREAQEAMEKAAPREAISTAASPAQPLSGTLTPAGEAVATLQQEDGLPRQYWLLGVALVVMIAVGLWRFRPSRSASK